MHSEFENKKENGRYIPTYRVALVVIARPSIPTGGK